MECKINVKYLIRCDETYFVNTHLLSLLHKWNWYLAAVLTDLPLHSFAGVSTKDCRVIVVAVLRIAVIWQNIFCCPPYISEFLILLCMICARTLYTATVIYDL
jgi:hypothetical protein